MRSVIACITALVVFVVSWLLVGSLLAVMGWIANNTGYSSTVFLVIHVFLIWILSPGVGAAIAIAATNAIFKTVSLSTIYVSFVSICATASFVLFFLGYIAANTEQPIGRLVVFLLQVLAIFVGAYVGRLLSDAERVHGLEK